MRPPARRVLTHLVVAAALTASAAACTSKATTGGSHSETVPTAVTVGADGTQRVTITAMSTFRFDPARITAHTGAVTVTLKDSGSYPHNLSVRSLGVTSASVSGGFGQNTTTVTLSFTHPGTYEFVCTYHSTAGRRGQFVIN